VGRWSVAAVGLQAGGAGRIQSPAGATGRAVAAVECAAGSQLGAAEAAPASTLKVITPSSQPNQTGTNKGVSPASRGGSLWGGPSPPTARAGTCGATMSHGTGPATGRRCSRLAAGWLAGWLGLVVGFAGVGGGGGKGSLAVPDGDVHLLSCSVCVCPGACLAMSS